MTPAPRKRIRFWLSLFIGLSVADLSLTWWLLRDGTGAVYEANPVAARILAAAGWVGLALFKALMVSVVLALILIVARSRPRTARMGLRLACVLMSLVVVYSGALAAGTPALDRSGRRELKEEMERTGRLDVAVARGQSFRDALHRLAGELARSETVLADAVIQLGREPVTHDRVWVRFACQAHPGLTVEQILARRLLDTVEEYRQMQSRTSPVSLPVTPGI